jgi:hypothetical protein
MNRATEFDGRSFRRSETSHVIDFMRIILWFMGLLTNDFCVKETWVQDFSTDLKSAGKARMIDFMQCPLRRNRTEARPETKACGREC